jgi:hypothetical protein
LRDAQALQRDRASAYSGTLHEFPAAGNDLVRCFFRHFGIPLAAVPESARTTFVRRECVWRAALVGQQTYDSLQGITLIQIKDVLRN